MAAKAATGDGNSQKDALERNVDEIEASGVRLANDVNALVQAWSQANAEVVKGALSVVGHLVVGLNDSLRQIDLRRTEAGEEAEGGVPHGAVEQFNEVLSGLSRNVSDALTESADVLQRSGQRFRDAYEESGKESGRGRKRGAAKTEAG